MEPVALDIKHLLKDHAYQNIPLGYDEAYLLGLYALQGCNGDQLAQIQSITALSALHNRATYRWEWHLAREKIHGHTLPKTAADQIAGICAVIFEHDIAKSEFGFLKPNVPFAMDNCGMGGDLVATANISTIAAFIASAAGIPMCKHGSPANADKGRHGSSDFIDLCGIDRFAKKELIESCITNYGFGYTDALDSRYKHIHIQTHCVAKLPHMNDIIGPITNPLCPKIMTQRVLGVNHLIPPRVIAETYLILNARKITNLQHGLFVRGFGDNMHDGAMDELSICAGGTQVVEIEDGKISEYQLHAKDFGIAPIPIRLVSPPNGMTKGDFSKKILCGNEKGGAAQTAVANATLLLYLAKKITSLREGYAQAEEILFSQKALRKMEEVQRALPRG